MKIKRQPAMTGNNPKTDALFDQSAVYDAAAEKLGYHPSLSHESAIKLARQRAEFVNWLNDKGIDPLDSAAVARYKRRQARKAVAWSPRVIAIRGWLVGLIAWLILPSLLAWWLSKPELSLWYIPLVAYLTVGVAIIKETHLSTWQAVWREESLSEYTRPVPSYALQTALEVHEAFPKATIAIDALTVQRTVQQEQQRVRLDPFLVVVYAGKRWYLEVWDEPAFDAKRLA